VTPVALPEVERRLRGDIQEYRVFGLALDPGVDVRERRLAKDE